MANNMMKKLIFVLLSTSDATTIPRNCAILMVPKFMLQHWTMNNRYQILLSHYSESINQ